MTQNLSSAAISLAKTNLSSAANEFVVLAEQLERRHKELEEKEARCSARDAELTRRDAELDLKQKEIEKQIQENSNKESELGKKDQQLKEVDEKMKKREEEWRLKQKKMKENADKVSSLVKMYVGGATFVFPKATLLEYKGSYFETMLTSEHQQFNGEYYIGYIPKNFQTILNFMTSKTIPNVDDELRADFSFFGLSLTLRSHMVPYPLSEAVASWFPNRSFSLLYGSRDFNAHDFHVACDNKGPTITILQSKEGYLCGGYNPYPWTSSFSYTDSKDIFLFTLSNPHQFPPTKYNIKAASTGWSNFSDKVFHVGDLIPVRLRDKTLCTKYFGSRFEDSTNLAANTFTGKSESEITDIEVYLII